MKRGDLLPCAGGSDFTGKPRPAVILQGTPFLLTASLTLCLLTSTDIGVTQFRVPIEPSEMNGLYVRSWAMVDKVSTMPRSKTGAVFGEMEAANMRAIERALLVFLGFA